MSNNYLRVRKLGIAKYNLTGVNEKGEIIETIIPYHSMNSIEVLMDGNYTLEIRYVMELKKLPYVLKVWKYNPCIYEEMDCGGLPTHWFDMEIADGKIRFYNFKKEWKHGFAEILLEFDKGVGTAYIMVDSNGESEIKDCASFICTGILRGQTELPVGNDFCAPTSFSFWCNTTWCSVWKEECGGSGGFIIKDGEVINLPFPNTGNLGVWIFLEYIRRDDLEVYI